MPPRFSKERCNGCPKAKVAPCEAICPLNLLYRDRGEVFIYHEAFCYDCAACVKKCPQKAIYLALHPSVALVNAELFYDKGFKFKVLEEE
ncbi:4Fe-4S dicluster domain-containing protein [Carboxydothermus hydrogenoformans]|uniref:Adenylylsulfate reductase n=1 Tax=Carboxydothermus hydrogenoformans (strain ATCC BAA-161 / DSM 6008 / Z-2901) TaxID=246194 RepID=Q3A8Q9_CARHZ|nr:4Fe-4S dicluster domain-containing protein [Carboxydothermus hydrogenoformans]ABB15351.1 adenylylsulfate reductase [Carboxydothermus hydrogenoformans Z-2901]